MEERESEREREREGGEGRRGSGGEFGRGRSCTWATLPSRIFRLHCSFRRRAFASPDSGLLSLSRSPRCTRRVRARVTSNSGTKIRNFSSPVSLAGSFRSERRAACARARVSFCFIFAITRALCSYLALPRDTLIVVDFNARVLRARARARARERKRERV